ncbi:MAG TPA: phosphoribosylformylglycinamidine synthase subunit PurS [Ktedonobacterales bacterium]|nr:phosphoribosylformylglycinamidine synthase subunit PurS [Ktedonobacterales bacterium]
MSEGASQGKAYRAGIQVTLKPSVLDPQGAAVAGALGKLGFEGVADVRVGRYVELRLVAPDEAAARASVERMCETLLANLVIERYAFSLTADTEGVG